MCLSAKLDTPVKSDGGKRLRTRALHHVETGLLWSHHSEDGSQDHLQRMKMETRILGPPHMHKGPRWKRGSQDHLTCKGPRWKHAKDQDGKAQYTQQVDPFLFFSLIYENT